MLTYEGWVLLFSQQHSLVHLRSTNLWRFVLWGCYIMRSSCQKWPSSIARLPTEIKWFIKPPHSSTIWMCSFFQLNFPPRFFSALFLQVASAWISLQLFLSQCLCKSTFITFVLNSSKAPYLWRTLTTDSFIINWQAKPGPSQSPADGNYLVQPQ